MKRCREHRRANCCEAVRKVIRLRATIEYSKESEVIAENLSLGAEDIANLFGKKAVIIDSALKDKITESSLELSSLKAARRIFYFDVISRPKDSILPPVNGNTVRLKSRSLGTTTMMNTLMWYLANLRSSRVYVAAKDEKEVISVLSRAEKFNFMK